jgi:uncharacterized membrane protein YjgN (DUF898 family)
VLLGTHSLVQKA